MGPTLNKDYVICDLKGWFAGNPPGPSLNMNLILSDRSFLNATYSNDAGQVIYKVETPKKLTTRISTITRVIPNDVTLKGYSDEVDMQNRFGFLAQIEHKPISSSVIKFGGVEVETKEYFRKQGWGWYGR